MLFKIFIKIIPTKNPQFFIGDLLYIIKKLGGLFLSGKYFY
ncbi:hypothetical protein HMPREF3229_01473 [Peptoniphilus harei]|uniref:Uncharacterized protein n=1 Tax=Peptoniphilus harei TaxID=54005 RepID=A0A133PKC5_9FIRM|nr:hypothetical protein HMPREF3229_01473 [Peptoniphilus harei]